MFTLIKFLFLALPLTVLAQGIPVIEGLEHVEGNRIVHLPIGREVTKVREDMLKNAKKSIYLSAFSMSTDEIGKGVYELLCQKAKAGLDVRVIIDHRNNKNFFEYSTKLKEKCGAYVISFRPGERWYALHEKILVVDGERFITGGSGYSLKYHFAAPESFKPDSELRKIRSEGWYDTDYLLEGPGACSIHHQFRTNFITLAQQWADYNPDIHWYGPENFAQIHHKYYGLGKFKNCASKTVKGDERAIVIENNPHKTDSKHRPILKAHLGAIKQTVKGEEILLYAPYFVPGTAFVKELVAALKRGVTVKAITNSVESTDEKTHGKKVFIGMITALTPAIKAGLKIYLWNMKSTIHRKGGKIGRVAFWGSDNLDNRAQDYQAEDVVYTDSAHVVEGMKNDFERDLTRTVPLSYKYVEKVLSEASFLDKLVGSRLKHIL